MTPEINGVIKADPVVLVLDDERLQLLSVRSQLRGVGTLVEFTRTDEALDYAKRNRADAMIVDIRMKGQPMDGLGFLRCLRSTDNDVSVIIRTADESEEIIDGAIELRAIRRLIKSRSVKDELRRYTLAAIAETRAKRRRTRAVSEAAASAERLSESLGIQDVALMAGSVYRGLIQSIRNDLSSLDGLAALLKNPADSGASLADLAQKNERVVSRMIREMDGFLDGTFGDQNDSGPASVNRTITMLRTHFLGASEWLGLSKSVKLRSLPNDALVDCSPVILFNGLKHLVEFALARISADKEIAVVARLAPPCAGPPEQPANARFVVNAGLPPGAYTVVFRVTGELLESATAEIMDAANEGMAPSRSGNLFVVNQLLAAARGAMIVLDTKGKPLAIDAILPVQRG